MDRVIAILILNFNRGLKKEGAPPLTYFLAEGIFMPKCKERCSCLLIKFITKPSLKVANQVEFHPYLSH